ncbi:MAG: hypothetical protein LBV08_10475 [Clostridiales bacterium]|jgi:hypothetical protein|nr:hypothetical protein [Clostridiales bacterium]
MEWPKAKTIIIITLLLLNAAFAYLNITMGAEPSIYNFNKEEIIKKLSQNNISYSFSDETEYNELEKISFVKFEYDYDKINPIFFEYPESLESKIEAENLVYSDETGTLIGEDYKNSFIYVSQSQPSFIKTGIQAAEGLCREAMQKLGPEFKGFKQETATYDPDNENAVVIVYKQFFKGYKINTNEVLFRVDNDKIIYASCVYFKPVEFLKESRADIYSSLDAVFAFMAYKSAADASAALSQPSGAIIDKISLTYERDQLSGDESFIPCYAIYLNNEIRPVLVNAYKNIIIE